MKRLKETKWNLAGVLLMVLLFVAASQVAWAQVTASMTGRVEDPSGATIPGANVTVTSRETGATHTATSNEDGEYQVLQLPVGLYDLKAEKMGFKASIQAGINLVVGQQAVVNLKLEVGAVGEQVTVTADAALVNTTTAQVSGLVGEKQVKDLPLNGRSFDLLLTLNAGTINVSTMRSGTSVVGGNLFSVVGRRTNENITLLNGVEYTGASNLASSPGGASGLLLGIDAVREYNVVTDTYGAEYGKKAGAQVSIVSQAGTNQFHGTLFEFLRNSELDARNFFDQLHIAPFKRNQFGGAAGGPIKKDKTFIFGNYEGFRQRLGISDLTFVPDLNARQGLLPCGNGGPTCTSGTAVGTPTKVANLNTGMLPYLNAFWPLPNGPELASGVAESFSQPAQAIQEDFGTARVDQTFSTKDTLSGVYTIDKGYNLVPSANPVFLSDYSIENQILSLQETHIFSPQVINSFTAGFSRTLSVSQGLAAPNFPANLFIVPGNISPGAFKVGASGNSSTSATVTTAGGTALLQFARDLFTYKDDVQVVRGKHQISAGVWFQRIRSNDFVPQFSNGQATFTNLTTLLQGTLQAFTINPPSVIPQAWRSWEGAWYVQDSIQLRPNFTLRVGLRHEFSNGWNEATGRASTLIFNNGVLQTLPQVSSNLLTQNNSKFLFSPRIGLAWDPFGKGKTSIRAAFGTYYDLMDYLGFLVDVTPPANGQAAFANVPFFSLIPVSSSATIPPPCGPGVPTPCNTYQPRSVQSNYKVPTMNSWNFTVEQQITRDTALRVAYTGFQAFHQFVTVDPNTIPSQICSNPTGCVSGGINAATGLVPQGTQYIPATCSTCRPNPYLSYGLLWTSQGNSSYNGLQVELTRRFTKGLQFRGNYTWSKTLDIQSADAGAQAANETTTVLNPYNVRQDWGPAATNAEQVASGNLSYELPFGQGKPFLNGVHGMADKLVSGWQANAIVTLRSGLPFEPLVGSNRSGNGDGQTPDRASVNPAFTGPQIIGSPTEWFNPNAFTLPTSGTFGNAGKLSLLGPGLADLDFSLFKNTHMSERVALQFRAEVFNILNRTNLGIINGTVFSGTAINPSAGFVSSTATTSRQIQFGLKLVF